MKFRASVVLFAAAASAIQVGHQLAPAATGYIYRSDNNGPASLIQLGAHQYQQPQQLLYTHPLQLASPLGQVEYNLAPAPIPAPLPYVVAKPIAVLDAEDDESDESDESDYINSGDVSHEGNVYEKGSGSDYGEEQHAAHGEKGSKGYTSKGHHAKGESGHYAKEHQEGHSAEEEGGKSSHHDEADAHGNHHEAAKSYKGGDKGHKKHFSKGEDIKGYHKVFHKDEFKKDHDFYDVADKSGHFNKHGYEKAHHGSEKGGHKKAGHHESGHDQGEFGKAGSHAKGHYDNQDAAHSAESGDDSHYNHEEGYGKKGGSQKENEYVYDDDNDEDYE